MIMGLEEYKCNHGKRYMGHSYEHLQRGRDGVKCMIIDFEKII